MASPLARSGLLSAVVFVTGACVLIVEVVAVRILAPYFGNTIFTFSSVISVILAALSVGYWLGGTLADKRPYLTWFFGLIVLSGLLVFGVQGLALWVLPRVGYDLSITTGPLLLSLLMFFLPGFVLGMLSPYAVKLEAMRVSPDRIGSVAGRIFFWSTLGSIAGSLAAGFFLVPRFGLDAIMLGTAAVLTVVGAAGIALTSRRDWRSTAAGVAAAAVGLMAYAGLSEVSAARLPGVIYEADGVYERIIVRDVAHEGGRPARVLQQDRAVSGLVYLDNRDPVDYGNYHQAAGLTTSVSKAVMIGGGTYVIPDLMSRHFPGAQIDVAEIEPSLFDLAQRYFFVPRDTRIINHVADGRRFLFESSGGYDLIFGDVYYALTVPPHFVTIEFYELVRDRLAPNGVFMANLVGDLRPEAPNVLLSQIRTLRQVFPNSVFFGVDSRQPDVSQSVIAMAINGDRKFEDAAANLPDSADPFLKKLRDKLLTINDPLLLNHALLTDNYAPVEAMAMSNLRRELAN